MKRLLLLLILILSLSIPALAQTPEPTIAPTPEAAPSDEPTAEAEVTPEATPADAIVIDTGDGGSVTIPVDETPEPDNEISLTIIEIVLMVIGSIITGGAGVGTLAYVIMKDPSRVRLMEKLGDSIPPETAAKIVGVTDLVTPVFVLLREMFDRVPYADKNAIEAGVASAFSAERQRERDNRAAQDTNRGLNVVPPPTNPVS
jgi:hypothetical protein